MSHRIQEVNVKDNSGWLKGTCTSSVNDVIVTWNFRRRYGRKYGRDCCVFGYNSNYYKCIRNYTF